MRHGAIALGTLAAGLWAGIAAPARAFDERDRVRYDACVSQAAEGPDAAHAALQIAAQWALDGGGAPALHCKGLALSGLLAHGQAALAFEAAAAEPDAGLEAPGIWAQAGNAWLSAGEAGRALDAFDAALAQTPADADLWIDRARAALEAGRGEEAIEDLGAALGLRPGDYLALGLRARALLNAGELEAALEDVEAALVGRGEDLDLLVLRGDVREAIRLRGPKIVELPAGGGIRGRK